MDKLLMSLISTAWGKNLIMWFFAVLVVGCASLSWACVKLQSELQKCNEYHTNEQKRFSTEKEALIREHLNYIKATLKRVEELEKKRKR